MKPHPRPYILVIFLGGGTVTDRHRPVTTTSQVTTWLRQVAEMNMIADIEGVYVASGLTPIGLPDWQRAATIIRERYDDVDGFVIAHQSETIVPAGTILSLMLRGIGKPVVLSGTSLPSTPAGYGVKANTINAVQVATTDLSGVVTVAGSHILRADAQVVDAAEDASAIIGKIEFGIRLFGQQAHRHSRAWRVRSTFDTHVISVEHVPGVDVRQSLHVPRGTRAVFVSVADVPWSSAAVVSEIRSALPASVSLVVYTGTTTRNISGAITVAAPSRTVAFMRLMWALGQTTSRRQLQALLNG